MKLIRILLAAVSVIVPATVLTAGPAEAYFYPNRYLVVAYHSYRCLDVIGGSPVNGTRIQQWDCDHNTWQQNWAFDRVGEHFGDPVFKISARSTSYAGCLDILGGGVTNGTPIQQWDCAAGTTQQLWIQEYRFTTPDGDNLFRYHSAKAPAMCLDVSGASPNNGARLVLWGCHEGNNQLFMNVELGPR